MNIGCKFCDEPPNPEQPGLYCMPHYMHAASDAARQHFQLEDDRCRLEDDLLRFVSEHSGQLSAEPRK